ncbi:MAG: hypothetical protein ACP5T3_00750 [Candidatus Micrarchaeia archaeon]
MFAKKADVASLLSAGAAGARKTRIEISPDELTVLKKLDTLRYPERTEANVSKLLSASEKKTLDRLIARKLVVLFDDEKRKEKLYSISKYVYDNFLMRKKMPAAQKAVEEIDQARAWGETEPLQVKPSVENKDVETLEKNGYVVLATEAEAAALSLAIAESIRQGQVLGVRAFNKKYYIMLRGFFEKNSVKAVSELANGPRNISELSQKLSLDPDALRGILYLMAEQGDVTENRKDVFALVS